VTPAARVAETKSATFSPLGIRDQSAAGAGGLTVAAEAATGNGTGDNDGRWRVSRAVSAGG
jgi:hypothetical protein